MSAAFSAIIIVVALVLARTTSSMIEASTTCRPFSPCTLRYWSTTAMWSEAGPILQVPDESQIHHLTVERASVTLVVGWMGSQLAVSVLI